MKLLVSRLLFYAAWPLFWLYMPLTRRVRAVIIQDGRVLVVKTMISTNKWQLPGGGIHMGEQPERTAERELREELGIEITNVTPLHEDLVILRQSGLIVRLTFVSASLPTDVQLTTNWEIIAYTWMPIERLDNCLPEVAKGVELQATK